MQPGLRTIHNKMMNEMIKYENLNILHKETYAYSLHFSGYVFPTRILVKLAP